MRLDNLPKFVQSRGVWCMNRRMVPQASLGFHREFHFSPYGQINQPTLKSWLQKYLRRGSMAALSSFPRDLHRRDADGVSDNPRVVGATVAENNLERAAANVH